MVGLSLLVEVTFSQQTRIVLVRGKRHLTNYSNVHHPFELLNQGVSEFGASSWIKAMAEESGVNQNNSERMEPEDIDEKANTHERLTTTKVPPKILPRYLSGPKSSCHDLCKYGIPHASEAKPWRLKQKRVTKTERKTEVPQENVISLARRKKSGRRSKPSQTPKIEKVNSPVDIKEVTSEKTVTSQKNSPPFEETRVSPEHNTRSEPSLSVQDCSKSETKKEMVKNESPSSRSRKKTESRSKQTRRFSTGGKEKSTPPSLTLSSKRSVKKPQSISYNGSKNMKRDSSLKRPENVEEIKPELDNNDNLPEKMISVTEPASANSSEGRTVACDATKLSSPSPESSGDRSLQHTNKKDGKSPTFASSRKGLRSVVGNKGKVNMQHKTRNVSRSPPPASSSVSTFKSSLRKQNNAAYKSNKKRHDHQGENVKMVYKIRPKISTKLGTANKTVVVASRKLNFRRGKVMELQPQSNNIPRRLKFRPARILGDDVRRDINGARKRTVQDNKRGGGGSGGSEVNAANTKSEKIGGKIQTVEGSKKRIIVGRKVGGDNSKVEGAKSGSEKVVLKHQDVEGKKENPRSYNNVIEETATMLTELRKSKVKALVGAFETVISLDSPKDAIAAEITSKFDRFIN
ncbi:unnamed protein product [Sphenostylis stenocarpa]|uniref:Calmodulin-binding domain-containing protein n=1 Tax=Sphenostylis stenocarpa TaxID=92480 RepID=A0AA86VEB8_9FABA|nr:unnamed protein product [Sphenostylis stenocarpa]